MVRKLTFAQSHAFTEKAGSCGDWLKHLKISFEIKYIAELFSVKFKSNNVGIQNCEVSAYIPLGSI